MMATEAPQVPRIEKLRLVCERCGRYQMTIVALAETVAALRGQGGAVIMVPCQRCKRDTVAVPCLDKE